MKLGEVAKKGLLGALQGPSEGPRMTKIAENDKIMRVLLLFLLKCYWGGKFYVEILSPGVGEQKKRSGAPQGLYIPKLKLMEEGLVNPHGLVNTLTTASFFLKQNLKNILSHPPQKQTAFQK